MVDITKGKDYACVLRKKNRQVKKIVAEEKEKTKQVGRPRNGGRKKTVPEKEMAGSRMKQAAAVQKTGTRTRTGAKRQSPKADNTAPAVKAPQDAKQQEMPQRRRGRPAGSKNTKAAPQKTAQGRKRKLPTAAKELS